MPSGAAQQNVLGMKPQTAALVGAGVLAAAGLGYLLYFDHKRRNNPEFRKQLKRERKRQAKSAKAAETATKKDLASYLESVLDAVAAEVPPTSPEEKEKYFMEQVALGEALCNQGPSHYEQALLPFYKAVKIYPAPLELLMIYQKSVPPPVFNMIVEAMSLDQARRQKAFYEEFPPKETSVKIGELPAGTTPEGKPIVRRGLVADKKIYAGQLIYTEAPLVSGLHPGLEGLYCNYCMKALDDENKVPCPGCDQVAFCSSECEAQANQMYHKYLCTNNKTESAGEKEQAFVTFSKEENAKYPSMIARFLSTMVAEEVERNKSTEPRAQTFNSWDHVDRFRYLDTSSTEKVQKEINILKELLGPKVQGISDFLTEEIYLMLKGKFLYNAYSVNTVDSTVELDVPASDEYMRKTPSDRQSVGAALYKISTYIGQSKDAPNTSLTFDDDHEIAVTALVDIEEGEELTADYTLPPKKDEEQDTVE